MAILKLINRHFPPDAPGWRQPVGRFLRFVFAVLEHIDHDKVAIRASGLAYTSLLAIVPLAAVVLAIFSAVKAFENIEQRVRQFLVEQFVAARQAEIELWIERFTDGASRLGVLGFMVLIVTSILLLATIESNFNQIWRVARQRPWFSRVTTYTSVLVLGSLFAGASLTLSAKIQTALVTHGPIDPGIMAWLHAWALPLGLSTLAFLVAYLAIPNASVSIKSATVGALCGAILFEAGKFVFARTTGASVNLSILYGSLAVLPIFLIWLYYTWIVVLVGLEVAYTHQYRGARSRPSLENDAMGELHVGLDVYLAVASRFLHSQPPHTADSLSRELCIPSDRTATAVRRLARGGLIYRAGNEQSKRPIWIPATPPDGTKLADVLGVLTSKISEGPRTESGALATFFEAGANALGDRSVADEIDKLPLESH